MFHQKAKHLIINNKKVRIKSLKIEIILIRTCRNTKYDLFTQYYCLIR